MNTMTATGTRVPMVAVIGDASVIEGSPKALLAEEIGEALVEAGYRIVTGGLGGVMFYASKGAHRSRRHGAGTVVGILPGFDPSVANPFVDVAVATGLDHLRNSVVANADAVVAVGGGAGTLMEICFAWIRQRPIVVLRVDGWSGELADRPLDHRLRFPDRPDDRILGASNAQDVVSLLQGFDLLAPKASGQITQGRG